MGRDGDLSLGVNKRKNNMAPIVLNSETMTDAQKTKAINALSRILFPAKGFHVPTLCALTGQDFAPHKGGTETDNKKG